MIQSPLAAIDTVTEARILRISCREGDEDNPDDDTETETTETETDGPDGKTKTKTTTKKDKADEGPSVEDQLAEERAARIQLQNERDAAAEEALAKVNEAKDEGERVVAERDAYKEKYEKLKDVVETSVLETAIMKQEKYQFSDPDVVQMLLDPKKLRLDLDTKKVEGLTDELKRIAKERPHLLKQPKEQQEEEFTPPPGVSGNQPRGGSAYTPVKDEKALGKKYKIPGYLG